jgi:hypothetical protein
VREILRSGVGAGEAFGKSSHSEHSYETSSESPEKVIDRIASSLILLKHSRPVTAIVWELDD